MLKNSRKKLISLIAFSAALGFGALEAKTLTFTSFGGAYQTSQREAYLKPFTAKTGIKINEASYDGESGKIIAMVNAGRTVWDVIDMEQSEANRLCEEGYLEPIDWDSMGDKDRFIAAGINECGVGSIVYSYVIGYDGDKIKDGPTTIQDFWNLKKWPGKRGLRKNPKSTLEFALVADGVSLKDVYKVLGTDAGLRRAFKKLDQIKDQVIWWSSGAQSAQILSDGEVAMTSAYNGRIFNANRDEGKNFKTVWDAHLMEIEVLVVPKGSKNKKEAMDFIRFASTPKQQAEQTKYIPYGPIVKDAIAFVSDDMKPNLPTYAVNLAKGRMMDPEFWNENGEYINERFQSWLLR
ncbi:MAG: spermidine/putrescine ABC transporter substrate-binding protein [SAR324 cluster bacterium]|uniref:Spermidine/putrescine ABC transporter substrate-binding protein n=1 Tax=SAR324 cluster bacterium TaxID=2024889 RepID=A0A2A4T3C7_9DELT|nr:MAG: spermidine/putrescine ABC transporter substrate-binding protein [SAR324 cluster bacterium]